MLLALGSRLGITASVGIWRQAGLWCTVAAAYYLAAQLGFRLRLPSSGISFLWPPTAILSAILLSIATRSWTVAMAGALAGHAIAHSIDGLPPFTWLAQFGANALQATLGAGLARYLSVGPAGFSTFRNVAAFVTGVVLVAPAIASMVAARLYVSMGWSATFAAAWSSRELSSVLAALTFTPPLVVAIDRLKRMDRGEPGQRIGSWVPIFSCVLFVIALAAAQYTLTHDTGLTGLSATDRLRIVQIVIAVSAVPLMLLAALFEESRAEHRALRESQRRYALAKAAAQEDERARIARNLHDSASQDLAALAIRLGVFQRDHTSPDPEQQRELTALRDRAIAIGEEIRQFAHELHPSILQRAGLPAAVAAHCEQFGADHRLQVDVACSTDTSGVPETVALCLYRACQEALHNVAKHAHATHVDVILTSTAHDVRLIVHDNGRGFDSRDRSGRTGIGLAGLDERLQQLDGTLVIDSSPGHGTTILATVPRGGA